MRSRWRPLFFQGSSSKLNFDRNRPGKTYPSTSSEPLSPSSAPHFPSKPQQTSAPPNPYTKHPSHRTDVLVLKPLALFLIESYINKNSVSSWSVDPRDWLMSGAQLREGIFSRLHQPRYNKQQTPRSPEALSVLTVVSVESENSLEEESRKMMLFGSERISQLDAPMICRFERRSPILEEQA